VGASLPCLQCPPITGGPATGFGASHITAAFATSLVTTSWENAGVRDRVNIVGAINDPTGLVHKLSGAGKTSAQALAQIDAITQGQAVMLATDQMFLITSVVFVVAAAVMWLAPKPVAGPPVMGGH
jgi:DHA2 family multidrug resistance protein